MTSQTNPSVVPNVEAAFIAHLRDHLSTRGYPDNDIADLRSLAIRAENIGMRSIARQPRQVELPSPTFVIKPELSAGFNLLCNAVRDGDDLTPFQSTSLLNKADFHDKLLADWGIHHFHLGAVPYPRDSRFMDRTGPVLFAFIHGQRFLALCIEEHGSWSDPRLLEILHANWPEAIAHCRVSDQLAHTLDSESDIAKFRSAGINGAVRLANGAIYRAMAGGLATDGTPIAVVLKANDLIANVRHVQRHLNERFAGMRDKVVVKRNVDPSSLLFNITIQRHGGDRDAGIWLDEETTGYQYLLQEAP